MRCCAEFEKRLVGSVVSTGNVMVVVACSIRYFGVNFGVNTVLTSATGPDELDTGIGEGAAVQRTGALGL